nr:hypothetical protein [Tanacetum cinerariifolium]
FWSTARIKTTDEGTKILATVDGKLRTISESSTRRNLKLNDEEGINTLPDAEIFENLTLMGYNILPIQKFTFPKGQFSHQWKYLIHTIMQCLSLKSTSFNEFSSNIATAVARIKMLEDKDGGGAEPSGDDALIKGRSLETGEEAGVEKSTERGSNDTEELVNVLTSMDVVNILTSGVQAVSIPPVTKIPTVSIPTSSGMVPTASPIFTTASVVTPYLRCKGKEKMVESDTPRKKKLQEQIDVHVAREIEEQMAREDRRRNEQIARDAEIARIHAEEELQMLIDGLARNNEMIAKHLQDYEQAAADLTIREKIDLINELVKYQDHHAKILKYQAQQSKPLSKKQQREFYMSVLESHSEWKTKNFKGMTLEEIREKFIPVWKQIKDFVPMASKEEGERFKRKGLRLEQGSAKKMKTAEDASKEDLKEMLQLVPVEEVYVEAL